MKHTSHVVLPVRPPGLADLAVVGAALEAARALGVDVAVSVAPAALVGADAAVGVKPKARRVRVGCVYVHSFLGLR